jgi:hypothetical protein
MIEVVLNGRLGNWLFQYAAARALALRAESRVQLDISRYVTWRDPRGSAVLKALRFFRLDADVARLGAGTRRTLEKLGLRARREDFTEAAWGYDPRFGALGPRTRLSGYFQSPRYWEGIEPALRADLVPRRLPDDAALARTVASMSEDRAVSVHVRRGDYLTTERALHGVCSAEYYERAIARMRSRVSGAKFFVFSDDLAWCREHFKEPDMTVVDMPSSAREPALDLYLMSRCSHHVISNSTYSWWGAWLDDSPAAIVCAPDRWFNDEQMSARAMRDTVPAQWLRIPCEGQTPAA